MRGTLRRGVKRVAVALLMLGLVACRRDNSTSRATPDGAVTGKVNVFAASSLTESFTALGRTLEADNPGLEVRFNFAASSALATQIEQGAEADVFASADGTNMDKVADEVEAPTVFARNRLAIVVQIGNPKQIASLTDLADDGTVVVLCGEQVPCGRFADQALTNANVAVKAASREENVKAVLTKVQLGEADAGIVYVTDVEAGGDEIEDIDIPKADNVIATYPIAALKSAANTAGARAFVDLVTSPEGSRTLRRYGFLAAA